MKRLLKNSPAISFYRQIGFPYRSYTNKNKCIFIHIPKSAGTSLLKALGKKKPVGRDHLPWYVYEKANPKKFENYFKFSFVRDPMDRLYSGYCYLRRGGNMGKDLPVSKAINKYSNFEDFIVNGLGEGWFRNNVMFLPQSFFIIKNNQDLAVDYVGKFETLEKDFNYIKSILSLDGNLIHANKDNDILKEELSSAKENHNVKKIVYEIYKQDFLMFDYNI